jgi:two-component system, NarL family, nitrate/nitrite response regulator NarL
MTPTPVAASEVDRRAIRVGIVDDHALVCETLALVLNEKGFQAVGFNPPDFESVLDYAAEHELHVILLDLNIGELGSSLPLIPQLRDRGYRVIVLTGDPSRPQWGACIEAGAACVVSKAVSFTDLLDRVTLLLDDVVERHNAERHELLESWRQHRNEERQRLAPFEQLTVREHEVLLALTLGHSAEEIAEAHYVSITTVRSHIRSILTKLGVNSQLAAVALAVRAGWTARA